jgi:outer membrane receptor protein involved in Fe transport
MRKMFASVFVFLLLLGSAGAASAQTADTASIRGRVTDANGTALAGVTATLEDTRTGASRTATSGSNGEYTIGTVPVGGSWRLTFARSGFSNTSEGPFVLRAGETATLNARLSPQLSEAVTVSGTAEHVRTDSPELGTRLDETALRNIPVAGRKITSLPLLNAAVRPARGTGDLFLNNTLFVVNGGGRRQTSYTIDGSTANDSWGRQTIFTNIPLSAVHELSVLTNPFSAEYGRTTGSVLNVVTRSGTNDLSGDVVALYRPASLQSSAPVTHIDADDELKQFSATIGGPIIRDRTHFFAAFEFNDQDRDSVITSALAPGVYTGSYRQTLAMLRVDHALGDANHLFARANLDRFRDTNPADVVGGVTLPSAGRTFRRETSSLQLSDTMLISASIFNEARAIAQRGAPITAFEPLHPSTQFVRPGVSTEGESRQANLHNDQYQLADTVSWIAGAHSLRFGVDALHSSSGGNGQEFGAPFSLGQFTFKTGISPTIPTSSLTIADVARYTQSFGNATYSFDDDLYALFVQDDWRPFQSLTVNAGLRYDHQKLTGDSNNVAPRLGFAWTPRTDTVVRGGYGVFYSQIQTNTDAAWELAGPTGFFNFSVAPTQLGFPTSLQPVTTFPTGANVPARDITIRPGEAAYYSQFFDVSKLRFYPSELQNPRTQQATLGFERELFAHWFLAVDGVVAHTTEIPWNLDANAPDVFPRTLAGATRTAAAADATRPIAPVPNGYRRILVTTNFGESKYRGVQLNARRTFNDRAGVLASYTWSHATNNVEADAPGGDPNDVNARGAEWADSLLDQRHRGVLTAWHALPFDVIVGGVATAASGRPFNLTTGADNNADGANTDRPVIGGKVVGRNAGKGTSVFSLDAFLEKRFPVGGRDFSVRAEGFNLTNRENVVGRNAVFGNNTNGQPLGTFGVPLGGISNVDPGRQYQIEIRARF